MVMSDTQALADAWDQGWETAARCYWSKPRNPYSGAMNQDDPDDYCSAHGGTGTPEDCNANPLPYDRYRDLMPPCPGPRP
jgi:hypothetical protein